MTKTGTAGEVAAPPRKGGDRLYEMVVRALRAEILQGHYPIGAPLPSEAALVSRFGVSRHTVREALRQLRDLGLVESRQGSGTIVTHPGGPQPYVHRIDSITDLHDFNMESRYFGETAKLVRSPPALEPVADKDGDPSWLRIEGVRFAPGDPSPICEVEIFVAAPFAGVGRLLGKQSGPVYALIEVMYGERIGEVEQFIRAWRLDVENPVLGLAPGETVIEVRRIYRTLSGATAEVTFNRYPADRFSMSMHLRRMRD